MAFGDSAVGLLFKISASDLASDVIKKMRSNVESDLSAIGSKGSSELDKLTGSSRGLGASLSGLAGPFAAGAAGVASIAAIATSASAALFSMAKSSSEFGSQIKDITEKTGLGAKTISALKFAADQSGSSIEAVSGSITKFTKLVGESAQGNDKASTTLRNLGVDGKKAITDLDGAFAQAVKRIYELPPGVEQTKAAIDAFGKSGADLIPVINATNGNLAEFIKKGEELGVVLTDEDARAADEFGDTLDTLKAQAQGVAFQFAKEFMPDITGAMNSVSKAFADNKDIVTDWGNAVSGIITSISTLVSLIKNNEGAFRVILGIASAGVSEGLIAAYQGFKNLGEANKAEAARLDANVVRVSSDQFSPLRKRPNDADTSYLKDLGDSAKKAKKEVDAIATALPRLGDGFKSYAAGAKQFGTSNTIENLQRLSAAFKEETGKIVGIGEISKRGGGKFGSHKEHNDGDDVDIRPIRKDGSGGAVTFRDLKNYDQEATRRLVQLIKAQNPGAIVLFNDPQLIREGLTRKSPDHDNHLHAKEIGKEGADVNLQAIADKREKEERDRLEKKYKIEEDAIKRRENLQKQSLDAAIKDLDREVAARERANKEILAKQEAFLADGTQTEENFAIIRTALEENLLRKRLENKEKELKLISDYNDVELAEFDRVAALRLHRAKPEDLPALKPLIDDERSALIQANKEEIKDAEEEIRIIRGETNAVAIQNEQERGEAAKKTDEERKRAALELLEIRREVLESEREILDFQKEQERKSLVNTTESAFGKDRITALVVLREFELKEHDRRRNQSLEDAKREKELSLLKIEDLEKEKLKVDEINKIYENRLAIINATRDAKASESAQDFDPQIRTAEREEGGGIAGIFAKGLGDLAGGGVDPLNKITEQGEYIKAVYSDLKDTAAGAIGEMVQGLGQMAAAWIATGKFSGKALLQMTSQILIGIATQAGIKALFELAEGYAALASFNPASAALHFAAASVYGTVAGVSAGAGVAVGLLAPAAGGDKQGAATSSFKQQSGTGSSNPSTRTKSDEPFVREEDRIRRQERIAATERHNREQAQARPPIVIELRSRDNHITEVVKRNIENRGDLHGIVIRTVEG